MLCAKRLLGRRFMVRNLELPQFDKI